MNEMKVARGLGWFSLGLGAAEVAAGRAIGRALGMEQQAGLLRAFGLREIAAGVGLLATERQRPWMWARVAGDVLDLGALATGLAPSNPKRNNAIAAFAAVAGITALDLWCARRLGSGRPHGSLSVHRKYVADGPSRRLPSGEFPAARR